MCQVQATMKTHFQLIVWASTSCLHSCKYYFIIILTYNLETQRHLQSVHHRGLKLLLLDKLCLVLVGMMFQVKWIKTLANNLYQHIKV